MKIRLIFAAVLVIGFGLAAVVLIHLARKGGRDMPIYPVGRSEKES